MHRHTNLNITRINAGACHSLVWKDGSFSIPGSLRKSRRRSEGERCCLEGLGGSRGRWQLWEAHSSEALLQQWSRARGCLNEDQMLQPFPCITKGENILSEVLLRARNRVLGTPSPSANKCLSGRTVLRPATAFPGGVEPADEQSSSSKGIQSTGLG